MFGLLGLLFLGSNLAMQSRWGTGWVAGKLQTRTKLEWEVGNVSWTPWSGVRLGELRAVLPKTAGVDAAPVCEIGEIRVIPQWGQLLRGQRGWREIVVRDPEVVLPVELVAAMGSPAGGTALEPAKRKAKPPAEKPPMEEPPSEEPPSEEPDGAPEKNLPAPKEEPGEPADPPKKPAPPKKAAVPKKEEVRPPPPGPRRVIKVEGARVALYSLKDPGVRVELRGMAAELPVSGDDSGGWIAADGLWLNEERVAAAWKERIEWKRPVLVLSERKREWNGFAARIRGTMQPGGAMRTSFDLQLIPGPLAAMSHPSLPGIEVTAERIGGAFRFAGDLRRPLGWRADAVANAAGVVITRRSARQPFEFEGGMLVAAYRGGVLRVPEARLVSEPLSFLGNGLVVTDGRTYGVLRIVANREVAEAFTKVALGSLLTGGWTREWLYPLGTPDRYYRDINLRGRAGKLLVDVGRRREELDAGVAWKRLVTFYNRETAEDERGEPRSPPREAFRPAP